VRRVVQDCGEGHRARTRTRMLRRIERRGIRILQARVRLQAKPVEDPHAARRVYPDCPLFLPFIEEGLATNIFARGYRGR